MPAPAALLVAAGITAVASNPVFIRFVYDPLIAPTLERLAENYIEQRRGRSRRPADPVDNLPQAGADDRNDIPLEGMRRRRMRRMFTHTSTSYENGDGAEELGLLMVQTAREPDETIDANMTIRRRPVASVPVIDNTIPEVSSPLFGVQGSESTTDREPNENVDADGTLVPVSVVDDNAILEDSSFIPAVQSSTTAREPDENVDTLHRRPDVAVLVVDNTTHEESSSLLLGVQGPTTTSEPNVNENANSTATLHPRPVSIDSNCRFDSERRTPLVSARDKKLRPRPTVAVSGLSLPVVPEWKTTVPQYHEESRRKDQVQWMNSVMARRPLPASSIIPAVSAIPAAPFPSVPSSEAFSVSDELNPDTLPQTPTHLITNSSVPSTPSSTTSSVRNVVFTPSQVWPLFSGTINPWNDVSGSLLTTQDGSDVPVSVSVSSVTHSTPSLQTDASSESSSTFQFSVPRNAPRAAPQLPPLPIFSPLCIPSMSLSLSTHSIHSNQPTSPAPQSPTLQSPPQSSNIHPHLTSSVQHRHCVHHPAAPNVANVPSSEIYQQHRFVSPGVMSSKLSELDFISE